MSQQNTNNASRKIESLYKTTSELNVDSKRTAIVIILASIINIILFLAYLVFLVACVNFAGYMYVRGMTDTNIGMLILTILPILLAIVVTYLLNRYIRRFYKWTLKHIK